MKVTKVWVNDFTKGKFLGFAKIDFSLNDSNDTHLSIKGFTIFQGDNGITMGLPSQRDENGKIDEKTKKVIYYPTFSITKEESGGPGSEFYEHIRSEIEKGYHEHMNRKIDKEEKNTGRITKTSGGNGGSGTIGDEDLPF